MRKIIVLLLITGFLIVLTGCKKPSEDKVAGTVNDERIMESEVESFGKIERLRAKNVSASNLEGEAVLDKYIERKIVLLEAKRQKITLSDKEYNNELKKTGEHFFSQEFRDNLKKNGITFDEWKKNMKEQLLFEKTVLKLAEGVEVTDAEIKAYYRAHLGGYTHGELAHAYQIVVENRPALENIKKSLEGGADFQKLAVGRSIWPDKDSGGDMGYFSREEMPPDISNAVFKTEPGKLSEILKTDYGYHIFLVVDKKKKGTTPLEDVRSEIIEQLKKSKTDKYFKEWIKGLAAKTNVKINKNYLEEIK